jgi:hypothetical protein
MSSEACATCAARNAGPGMRPGIDPAIPARIGLRAGRGPDLSPPSTKIVPEAAGLRCRGAAAATRLGSAGFFGTCLRLRRRTARARSTIAARCLRRRCFCCRRFCRSRLRCHGAPGRGAAAVLLRDLARGAMPVFFVPAVRPALLHPDGVRPCFDPFIPVGNHPSLLARSADPRSNGGPAAQRANRGLVPGPHYNTSRALAAYPQALLGCSIP